MTVFPVGMTSFGVRDQSSIGKNSEKPSIIPKRGGSSVVTRVRPLQIGGGGKMSDDANDPSGWHRSMTQQLHEAEEVVDIAPVGPLRPTG